MNLVIDIGNTNSKMAVFHEDKIVKSMQAELLNSSLVKKALDEYPIHKGIITHVKNPKSDLIYLLKKRLDYLYILSGNIPVPVENLYKTRESLGYDRLAGAVGANNIFPGTNVLIIDLGTAITYDFVNDKNQYTGGNISPGMRMRFRALNTFTEKLPLVKASTPFEFLGDTTEGAIAAGVKNGIIFELNGYIQKASGHFDDLKIIITGGDAHYFVNSIKKPIFAEPDLVLIGLNRILKYNVA